MNPVELNDHSFALMTKILDSLTKSKQFICSLSTSLGIAILVIRPMHGFENLLQSSFTAKALIASNRNQIYKLPGICFFSIHKVLFFNQCTQNFK